MSKEKAELVDKLNVIQRRIGELGLGAPKELIEERDRIREKLDLLSNQEKNGGRND